MTWNPVLDFVVNVKQDFLKIYSHYRKVCNVDWDDNEVYDYANASCSSYQYRNVIEYWVDIIDKDEYREIISDLEINQYNDFALLRYAKYSNIFSGETDVTNVTFWDLYDGFYRECRTVVIDIKQLKIVLCGFKKFFNINELPETDEKIIIEKINNAKSFEVSDKLDGSMQIASYYNGEIVMCGSQAINPEKSWRLQDGIRMLNSEEYSKIREAIKKYPEYCFIFEYISLQDAHVVVYKKEQEGLYLIGIRNKNTGVQLPYKAVNNIANTFHIKTTKLFDKTFDEIKNDTKTYKSNEKEGYVLNIDGYLVKIKVDDYVLIHNTISKLSSINATIKSIADDTFDDFVSKVPKNYQDRIMRTANFVFNYIEKTKEEVEDYLNKAPKNNRKDFMIWVDKNVPKCYNGYVKNLYLGNKNNYVKTATGHYKKMSEMGYKGEYLDLFDSAD